MQVLLTQGIPLASIMNYALRLALPTFQIDDEPPRWVPPRWNEHLAKFYEVAGLAKWWVDEDGAWEPPLRHLREAFANIDLYAFFKPYLGTVVEQFVFMPNITYPSDQTLSLRLGGQLVVIMPPPMAWGDSPPWPYKDDPALAYRAAIGEYGGMILDHYLRQHEAEVTPLTDKPLPLEEKFLNAHGGWRDQFIAMFRAATTAMFLEDSVSALEARSYVQQMGKVEGFTSLPAVVTLMRRYQDEIRKYPEGFVEFLPVFLKQLKVARTIGTK